MESPIPQPSPNIAMPNVYALAVNASNAVIMSPDGEVDTVSYNDACERLHNHPILLCNAPYVLAKLKGAVFHTFDILELFAFVHPGRFCVPTPAGIAKALGFQPPQDFDDLPFTLLQSAEGLLKDLQSDSYRSKANPADIAPVMGLNGKGWAWTPYVMQTLGDDYDLAVPILAKKALGKVWKQLPEWAEEPPPPAPSHHGVTRDEARDRLQKILLTQQAETREAQVQYTQDMAHVFSPPQNADDDQENNANIVLAEAGTGTGKTLGYLAPASVWAEKNEGAVWISTYTKNLQTQIDRELNRLYPQSELKDRYVSIRKGRENYMCLLNYEDLVAGAGLARDPQHAIAAGILARWLAVTKDGDINGAGFPGWLTTLLGFKHTGALADRRGECIYAACDHYTRCFTEHSQRKSKMARIVVANHALVMIGAAMSAPGDDMPTRYIFDEGHHIFQAADSAFSAHLTARETQDLRRWLLGAEGGQQTRARGLKKRCSELIEGDSECDALLQDILHNARILTARGWSKRLKDGTPERTCEKFLHHVYHQINTRSKRDINDVYSLETPTLPMDADLIEAGKALANELAKIQAPMKALATALRKKLENDEGTLESDTRIRLDSVAASLERRALMIVQPWIDMLNDIIGGKVNPHYVDWLEITRVSGKSVDVGLYRHHLNPAKPFAASMKPHAHGIGVTSATLLDQNTGDDADWDGAKMRTGMTYLGGHAQTVHFPSPFDYKNNTRVYILNDVNKSHAAQVAGAFQALFKASNGGALGLFTAITRLKTMYDMIAAPLEDAAIPLYAQHIDNMHTATLIDMFRDEDNACLLGTDAMRDGVDVPGRSLRLIAFDRVPWPRPTILHKARRKTFGGKAYDEMLTRMKIKQAYGRLIRKADDKGVFVMMDSGFPSRLHNAFPPDVEVVKCGLKEAVKGIEGFLDG